MGKVLSTVFMYKNISVVKSESYNMFRKEYIDVTLCHNFYKCFLKIFKKKYIPLVGAKINKGN